VLALISSPRDPDKIKHQLVDLIRQWVDGLACGYEDLNDHDTLLNDIAIQKAVKKIRFWAALQPFADLNISRTGAHVPCPSLSGGTIHRFF